MRERKEDYLTRRGGGKELGEIEEEETAIMIYCMRR